MAAKNLADEFAGVFSTETIERSASPGGVSGPSLGSRAGPSMLEDPAGKPLDAVRPIRDEIGQRVQRLLGDLLS